MHFLDFVKSKSRSTRFELVPYPTVEVALPLKLVSVAHGLFSVASSVSLDLFKGLRTLLIQAGLLYQAVAFNPTVFGRIANRVLSKAHRLRFRADVAADNVCRPPRGRTENPRIKRGRKFMKLRILR